MKSTPGSDRATPLHGHVKFVPSMRNWFSLVPEPNADTLLVGAAARRGRRDAGGGPDEVEHAGPSRRDRLEVLGAEARLESAVSRFDARARSLDDDRFGDACQLQDRRSLDGGAGADADVLFVIGRESLELDVEHVRSGRQSREAQLPFLVRVSSVAGPPISAGELTRTTAPEGRRPVRP